MPLKVLIVDDHSIVRMGIQILLKDTTEDFIFYEAENYKTALDCISKEVFDLVILDVNLPDGKKTLMIKEMQCIVANLKILVFTAHEEEEYVVRYLKSGANAFVSKMEDEKVFVTTVLCLINEEEYVSERIKYLIESEKGYALEDKLSTREFEVAMLLVSGFGNLEISNQLNLKMSTISTYKNRIFEKLKISNTLELVSIFNEY